jgi:hypothetical protein
MKADLTRRTFRHERHYISTLQQQGRVPIDADWNEQGEIQQHRDESEAIDVIGPSGFPNSAGNFLLGLTPDGSDVVVDPGRGYVDGILCELDADPVATAITSATTITPLTWTLDGTQLRLGEWISLSSTSTAARRYRITAMDPASLILTLGAGSDNLVTLFGGANQTAQIARVVTYGVQPEWWQPDDTTWPNPPALPSVALPAPGIYLAYLDVWRRHVTALEDPEIREVALGGPDTCTRVRTTWQVRLSLSGSPSSGITCASATLPAPITRGALAARAKQPAADTPCVIAPTARYRSLENQLYRVEVHEGGLLGTATFKYSTDNGSFVSAWTGQTGMVLNVASTGKDSVLRFSAGDWVELIDDSHELAGAPGTLVKVASVGTNSITITVSVDIKQFPLNPRIRKWDQTTATGTMLVEQPGGDGYLDLDSGVQIRFEPGAYTTGDYWMIPARTITTDVDWPKSESGASLSQPPLGIQHHYAKLGLVTWSGTKFTATSDCRALFPPLTNIHANNVIMDPGPCDFPANVKTVQDAISEICQQKANACCELVIVPGDDVQSAIDDALAKNVAAGINGLHVCFAAGTHKLAKTITVIAPKTGGDITLSGCGLASHVDATVLGTAFSITGWTTAAVMDLTIFGGLPPPKPKPIPGQLTAVPTVQAMKIPSAVVTMVDCASAVIERAAITCGAASTRVTQCIAIVTTTLPSTSAARVEDCDLAVGNRQIGIGVTNADRSTIEGNRIDVTPLTPALHESLVGSDAYLGTLRSRLFSDLRIGSAAAKTVDTIDGTARNHVTIDNVKIAFTSDSAAAALWSKFAASGRLAKLAKLDRADTLANAIVREKAKKSQAKKAAPPAAAPPPATTAAAAAPATTPTTTDAQAIVAVGRVPNNLAARIRTKLKQEVTKILRTVSNPSQTASQLAQQGIEGFGTWKQGQDASVVAAMSDAIVISGNYAGDVRILDNAVSGTETGIRVAITAPVTSVFVNTAAPPKEVSVRRARVSGNTVAFAVPAGTKGQHSGVYVGNCASLIIEDNYARQKPNAGSCVGVRVLGKLGKMMRAEGNHALHARIGIEVKPEKPTDKTSHPEQGALWILSQNVAESTTTAIVAPATVVKINNAP